MSLQSNCVLWNKLESGDPAVSEIGPNLSWRGTSDYSTKTGRFGNGAYTNTATNSLQSADSGAVFGNVVEKLMFSCWLDLDFSITDGIPSDSFGHYLFQYSSSVSNNLYLVLFETTGLNFFIRKTSGGTQTINVFGTTGVNVSANTKTYFMFAWDRAGISGGSNTIEAYIGTQASAPTQVFTSTATLNAAVNSSGAAYTLMQNVSEGANRQLDGMMDNVKLYNDATDALILQELANYNNEGFFVSKPRVRLN
jgi:hypothetical protein